MRSRAPMLFILSALLSCSAPETPPDAIAAARARIHTEAATQPEPVPLPVKTAAPSEPTVPRTSIRLVEIHRLPQVYVDHDTMLAHRKQCPERKPRMLRMPRSVARTQGYSSHATCETLIDLPEYRQETVVHPDWIAYEAALATEQQRAAVITAAAPAPSSPSWTAPSSYSSDEVQVRGYVRKDGTYVRPHTRSAPRKN